MLDHYDITTLEQLRAISDILRVRIMDTLKEKPMTATQLAEIIGQAPAKIHYHVRELEKVGLLKLVETREKGGILEKYYLAIAREIRTSKALFASGPQDEAIAAVENLLEQASNEYISVFRRTLEKGAIPQADFSFSLGRLYVIPGELQELFSKVQVLFKEYETPRGREGEREFVHVQFNYPEPEQGTSMPTTTITDEHNASTQQVSIVGAYRVSRDHLVHAMERGNACISMS
ncbi:winged helix-turn-helix domain-containing protein [Ktedonospora formicarum]|uniref:HTH arsR-type domain-containing protein n=1 Tax=Ktedonospora formicarum TaxID=2778364 RepID=A0A8J3HX30_9CHLR|nr:winged helix-turn-helix domain-containing protein [Ktedonospora formicarum]GHO43591.1 hypothetical protein KSX_17540 [Ktedonospora formicarum]